MIVVVNERDLVRLKNVVDRFVPSRKPPSLLTINDRKYRCQRKTKKSRSTKRKWSDRQPPNQTVLASPFSKEKESLVCFCSFPFLELMILPTIKNSKAKEKSFKINPLLSYFKMCFLKKISFDFKKHNLLKMIFRMHWSNLKCDECKKVFLKVKKKHLYGL